MQIHTKQRFWWEPAAAVNFPGTNVFAPDAADASTVSTLSDCTPDLSHKQKANGSTCESPKKFWLNPVQANLSWQSNFQEQQRQAENFAKATSHY